MIQIDSITVAVGSATILEKFSLCVSKGQKVAVFGESGAGKSTLLKTLIGMHIPQTGSIRIGDLAFVPENLPTIRKQVFYLPQDIVPHGEETVLDYLTYPFGLTVNKGILFREDRMEQLFSGMRLKPELVKQPFYKLSGGERKRVGLLLGLLLERPLMLLDEPTAGVDTRNRDSIADLLFADNNITVVAVTHDEALIARSDAQAEMTNSMAQRSGI